MVSIYQSTFLLSLLSFQMRARSSVQVFAQDSGIFAEVFHVPEAFNPDYEEMERNFKIFVYPHNTAVCDQPRKLDGEYGNEGLFYLNLNQSRFLTEDPEKAHLFFIPTSCDSLPAEGRSEDERAIAVEDFVKSLISKYPYWNRTLGADHFFVTCTDIHVTATARIANLMKNSIRVMCSPSYDVEYVPHKDVSLPQLVPPFLFPPTGINFKDRPMLAFWRGVNDSYVREKLLHSWEHDPRLIIQKGWKPSLEEQDLDLLYHDAFNISKFCICPRGPGPDRYIALAIHYGCVPVIFSDYYDLPFKDILDWKKFSVILSESELYLCPGGPQLDGAIAVAINYGCVPVILSDHYDLPFKGILDWKKFSVIIRKNSFYRLEGILADITMQEYEALYTNTIMVQKHFQWNLPPVRLDAFHMVIYELWLRHHVTKYY